MALLDKTFNANLKRRQEVSKKVNFDFCQHVCYNRDSDIMKEDTFLCTYFLPRVDLPIKLYKMLSILFHIRYLFVCFICFPYTLLAQVDQFYPNHLLYKEIGLDIADWKLLLCSRESLKRVNILSCHLIKWSRRFKV